MNTTSTVKKTRTRKTAVASSSEASSTVKPASLAKDLRAYDSVFEDLFRALNESKEEFVVLQKEIDEVRGSWSKEQKDRETAILERNQQEEVMRKREKETYDYETMLSRKKVEDEFLEKKAKWERELEGRKEEIAKEKLELENLRKLAGGFDQEKEKAIKQACAILQKELSEEYITEKRLREQEVKSEKELLGLKISNLSQESTRQASEIMALKKALEDATGQLKEIAVKVIESSSPQVKPSNSTEP